MVLYRQLTERERTCEEEKFTWHSLHVRQVPGDERVGEVQELKIGESSKDGWDCCVEGIAIQVDKPEVVDSIKVEVNQPTCKEGKRDVKIFKVLWETGDGT